MTRRQPPISRGGAVAVALFVALAVPSAASTQAVGAAPANTTPPAVTGSAVEGATLTVDSGSWNGATPLSFTYQWRLCNGSGDSCADIPGATSQTHVAAADEVGGTFRVRVTAANADGSAEVVSGPTQVLVHADRPVNTAPATLAGTARDGETLTTSDGTWTGAPAPTYAYAWERCDTAAARCVRISGSSTRTYRVGAADVGFRLRSVVTATNPAGSATTESGPTRVVDAAGRAPRPATQPNVMGTPKLGATLTSEPGLWSGSAPIQLAFSWQRCDAKAHCTPIGGAVHQTYVPVNDDVGHRLRAIVAATNSSGSATIATNLTAAISTAGGLPVLTSLPRIAGGTTVGAGLTATSGTWSGATNLRYTYAWLRCDAHGDTCAAIPNASQKAYALTAADVGHTIRVRVTAGAAAGATSATSAVSAIVAQATQPVKQTAGAAVVDADSVNLPQRLVISGVAFTPSRITSRAPFIARFRVTDTKGDVVRNALVYVIGLPYGVLGPAVETRTDGSGYATIVLEPTRRLSLRRGGAIVMFVRARSQSGSLLAGVSTRRLVQVLVGH